MRARLWIGIAALMMASGMAGGVAARWLFAPESADAQAGDVRANRVLARTLLIEDNRGRLRMGLTTLDDRNGSPGMLVIDANGRQRLLFETAENGQPSLLLFDRDERVRADLTVRQSDGLAGLDLLNADGKLRASIREVPDGGAGVAIYDRDGRVRGLFSVSADGRAGLSFLDADGRPVAPNTLVPGDFEATLAEFAARAAPVDAGLGSPVDAFKTLLTTTP